LSNSDAGQAYKIFFVDQEGRLADSTRIVISGVDYEDGIYNLKNSRANNGRLKAKYNANASLDVPVSVINSFGEEVNGGQNRKLAINNITGDIDIAATVRGGAINRDNQNNEFIVRYRINDRSSRAQNKLKVKIYQFSSEEAVPQDILDTIKEREEILKRVNAMPVGNSSGEPTDGGTLSGLDPYAKPVRPPLILVIN
jgi:vacuolar-type H+-ATPase subunit I/STV1